MLRYSLTRLGLLWLFLVFLLGAILMIAPHLPSKGTLLLTHNVFLNRYNRFEFYDISRGVLYGFSPTFTGDVVSATLAPNGRYVAFLAFNEDRANLNITTLSGQVLTEAITIERLSLGSWSRDSRYFVQEDGESTIFVFDIVESDVMEFRVEDEGLSMPSWSRDNAQIVFIGTTEDLIYKIWFADTDSDTLREVINTTNIIRCPIFSPDGESIAYFQRAENGNQLKYINLDGSSNHNYESGQWRTTDCPLWSTDERYVLFMAFLTQEYTSTIILQDVFTGETDVVLDVDPTTNIQWWR